MAQSQAPTRAQSLPTPPITPPTTPIAPPAAPPAPSTDPAEAEPRARLDAKVGDAVIVVQSDGSRLEGVLVARTQYEVIVRIAGVEARIPVSKVERLIPLESALTRYRQMRALIDDDDVPRLVMLAEWLQKRRLYTEALREVEGALAVNPNDADALRLHRVLLGLVRLHPGADQEQDKAPAPRAEPSDPAPRRPTPAEFPVLRPEQISMMKVFEVDLRDSPRIVIARQIVDRLLNEYADSPLIPSSREGREAFLRKSPAEVLDIMFRVRARNLYEHVQVLDQPRSMRLFRDTVHGAWLINACATTRCHGGSASGRLRLTNYRPNSDEAVYTNFLILERFTTSAGLPLINYTEPEKSVLLQMGLPRDDALYPHPIVAGWRPVFRSRDSRRFHDALEWINALYRPRPDYPIDYTPPGQAQGEPPTPDQPTLPGGPVER